MGSIRWLLLLGTAASAACSSDFAAGPAAPPCSATLATEVALAPGAYTAIDPAADSGCVSFPANVSTGDSAEYLVIAQSAGGVPGDTASFGLRSASLLAGAAPAELATARCAVLPGRRGSIAARFDGLLHELERTRHAIARTSAVRPTAASFAAVAPPTVGSLRTFTVCANLDCTIYKPVTARAQSVGVHVVIYVDTVAPANGLTATNIDTLQHVFDTHVYAVDTAAFGTVSDIDSNGVVITLMTPVVNSMVTNAECQAGGFVEGFFDPADLDPSSAAQHNHGEIFYTIVADPNGALSCSHTVADVESSLPGTFLHELQHVIGFNQHVLVRGGNLEDLWLDEALSSFAEELGGRSFLPDSTTFETYVVPDLADAYDYLANPGAHFLLQTSDTILADFGAGWLYVRYLVDQFGDSLTDRLEQTALTGADNVAAQTGLQFETTTTRWALANWVSDLPGFAPPAGLFYRSWSFRQVFASFYAQDPFDFPLPFPLVPPGVAGTQVNLAGTMHAGSGFYVDILQAPGGGGFALRLSGSGGLVVPAVDPRLDIIRIR
ncbi:MAG TPA: hypothetical protein VK647_10520 [Gemmatimonadales bacterium]|nr:hypothetical protein [Gemmatimonadales bacterium]